MLKALVEKAEAEDIPLLAKEMEILIAERNAKCKLLKYSRSTSKPTQKQREKRSKESGEDGAAGGRPKVD